MNSADFKDIAPYDNDVFQQKMEQLIAEPRFADAIKYVVPNLEFPELANLLRQIPNAEAFQKQIMFGILKYLEQSTTTGVTVSGWDNIDAQQPRLYISNHRDIVLDSSFLGLIMLRNGLPAQQIALGDNLLIYDWIELLVRLNKGIIVKRNLRLTKALEAAKQLSAYIHYCILHKHESVWIAQREGRAKDSNDLTQESVLKMLCLEGETELIAPRLLELNITPVSISYEYDPSDYLKAAEFLARHRDPEFKKSQKDDLKSMETGLLQNKGEVHFALCPAINAQLGTLKDSTDKTHIIHTACHLIDHAIHANYKIYPINYYAFDTINNTKEFSTHYSPKESAKFENYFNGQLNKVELPDITPGEREYMLHALLEMYANPLKNKMIALNTVQPEPK